MFFVSFAVSVKGMGRKESFGFERVARTFVAYIYYINNIILSVWFSSYSTPLKVLVVLE